jgi:hypothetical protein
MKRLFVTAAATFVMITGAAADDNAVARMAWMIAYPTTCNAKVSVEAMSRWLKNFDTYSPDAKAAATKVIKVVIEQLGKEKFCAVAEKMYKGEEAVLGTPGKK